MRLKKNYKPCILYEAKNDMRSAALWFNKQEKGLGEKVQNLQPNPLICQVRYKEIHTAIVEQFPYMIHYTIDITDKIIYVIAVLHTSQNPQIWNERTE